MIELRVESGKYGQIVLVIENTSDEIITLKHITLLWSINFFDYSEISRIGPCEGQLFPGNLWITLAVEFQQSNQCLACDYMFFFKLI